MLHICQHVELVNYPLIHVLFVLSVLLSSLLTHSIICNIFQNFRDIFLDRLVIEGREDGAAEYRDLAAEEMKGMRGRSEREAE